MMLILNSAPGFASGTWTDYEEYTDYAKENDFFGCAGSNCFNDIGGMRQLETGYPAGKKYGDSDNGRG